MHAGIAPGISFVRISGSNHLQQQGLGQGIFLRGTLTWDMKKEWLEGGGGIEFGKMSGRVLKRDTITVNGRLDTYWKESWEEFVSPYANMHISMNAKWILAEGKYLYAGGVTGMMLAKSGLLYKKTVTNWYAGLTAGVVFRIDDITGLDIAAGWRNIKLNGSSNDDYKLPDPTIPEYTIEGFKLRYVNLSLGIVVTFR